MAAIIGHSFKIGQYEEMKIFFSSLTHPNILSIGSYDSHIGFLIVTKRTKMQEAIQ
jgi:hypothetical protein